MKNKIVSAFLGGFLGIFLSGFFYYLNGEHSFILVPAGTFLGCLIGFSWGNISQIKKQAKVMYDKVGLYNANLKRGFYFLLKIKHIIVNLPINTKNWIKRCRSNLVSIYFNFKVFISKTLKKLNVSNWFKTHPMNVYKFFEILFLSILVLLMPLAIYYFDLVNFANEFFVDEENFFRTSLGIAIFSTMLTPLVVAVIQGFDLVDDDQKKFYSNFSFYSRLGILGVFVKIFSKFVIISLIAIPFLFFSVVTFICSIFYAFFVFMFNLFLMAIAASFKYVIKLARDKKELSTLIITIIVTSVYYFVYRTHFDEVFFIWLISFASGTASSLIVYFALSLNLSFFKKVYKFIDMDNVEIDEKSRFSQSLIGIIVFMLFAWIFKKFEQIFTPIASLYQKVQMLK